MSTRVAVVGAGLAGLTAARELAQAGHEVVVFDKARGAGGRTATRRRDDAAYDHGAQYFTCRTPAFEAQVADWCRRGVAAVWDGELRTLQRGTLDAAPKEVTRYVGLPRMSALARDLATSTKLECGQRIERLAGTPARRALVAEGGEVFEDFTAVVVATPAPQAVPLLAEAPPLAHRVAAIPMLPCQALMLSFAVPLETGFGGAFVEQSPLAWVARNTSKPGRPAGEDWVLHASAAWSQAHLEDPPEVVDRLLQQAFAEALDRELPAVVASSAHRWRYARTESPVGEACLWDAAQGIGVCGDWLLGARVEDAYTSGRELARRILSAPLPARACSEREEAARGSS